MALPCLSITSCYSVFTFPQKSLKEKECNKCLGLKGKSESTSPVERCTGCSSPYMAEAILSAEVTTRPSPSQERCQRGLKLWEGLPEFEGERKFLFRKQATSGMNAL